MKKEKYIYFVKDNVYRIKIIKKNQKLTMINILNAILKRQ